VGRISRNLGPAQREGLSVIIRLAEFGQSGIGGLTQDYRMSGLNKPLVGGPRVKGTSGKRLTRSNYILAEPN